MKDSIKIAIITAVSVGLTIYLGSLLKISSYFYASIAAAVVSQTSYKEVFKLGIKRILGTLLGAGIGLIFFWILPHSFVYYSIGIFIIVMTCSLLINVPANMACIVFLAVSVNLKGAPPLNYAMYRVADTGLGIITAFTVSFIFKYIEDSIAGLKRVSED